VRREIKGDAPFGLFISGGVNSSIIAGIVAQLIKNGEIDLSKRGMRTVNTFCIGLEGSPDLHFAKKVAEFYGFEHHSITYTVEEGLDYIPEVIYHTETFNNITIRTSTPLYIMCRRIKALGIKICLTGEGSDELFGGYLYFHKAPNRVELH
jgi:asparagine synthase (glutamine-hydrolysing)